MLEYKIGDVVRVNSGCQIKQFVNLTGEITDIMDKYYPHDRAIYTLRFSTPPNYCNNYYESWSFYGSMLDFLEQDLTEDRGGLSYL